MSGRVPPSSKAGKRGATLKRSASGKLAALFASSDVRKAANLWQRFSGGDIDSAVRVQIPDTPAVAAPIGSLDAVMYTTVRDGKVERYIHRFAKSDRPLLAVTPDGRQMLIVGGLYRFTEAGIVDDSDLKHRHLR